MPNRAIEYVYKLVDQYSATMKKMSGFTKQFKKDVDLAGAKVKAMSQKIGQNMKRFALVGVGAVAASVGFMVKKASEMENVTAAFTPLMGGAEKATELVNRLNKEAATTPFQFSDISKAAKQLLPVMNQDINKTADTFRMLGDTAGGNAQKLDSITRGYTKAMLKGKVDMESLNMIAEAGVPIFTEMADTMGYGKDQMGEMFKQISKGTVGTEVLSTVFKRMTSEGGTFFKGMEISSKTLSGVWSTFKDNIGLTAASIGQVLLPYIKELVGRGIEVAQKILKWVQANKDLIKIKVDEYLTKTIEVIKKAIKIFTVVFRIIKPFIPLIAEFIIIMFILKKAYMAWTIAQWILNAAMSANVVSLVIIAISALIAAIITLIMYKKQIIAFTAKWWDKLKGLLLLATPFVQFSMIIVEVIREIVKSWDVIVDKFKAGDILGAIKEIGKAIVRGMLSPIESLLKLVEKLPGMKKIAPKIFAGIEKIKEGLGLNIGESKGIKTPEANKNKANVDVKTNVSVYADENTKVVPFKKRGNLGLQMKGVYAK